MRDRFGFLWRQVVKVLVHWVSGVDLVLNPIKTGHQERSEGKVWISRRIREAGLDTLGFGTNCERNADRGRAVAAGISEHHRCFKSWHQTLVGICRGVGDRIQCARMFDDPANIVEARL